jgi:hypothetical protein
VRFGADPLGRPHGSGQSENPCDRNVLKDSHRARFGSAAGIGLRFLVAYLYLVAHSVREYPGRRSARGRDAGLRASTIASQDQNRTAKQVLRALSGRPCWAGANTNGLRDVSLGRQKAVSVWRLPERDIQMFGSKRRKAVRVAVDNIRPIIGIIQYNYGIPAGFWQDEYLLGFFGFLIGFHMQRVSGGTLSQTDKGQGLADAFTEISNINGAAIARQFTTLAFAETEDFKRGGDNAALIAFYTIEALKNESENEHVKEAKQIMEKLGEGNDRAQIAGILMHNLLINDIAERFKD